MEFFLLAWFQSDLAEVAEDGAVYSNDDRSAVVAALPVEAKRHSFFLAGGCSYSDVDFCAFASLHEFVTVNAGHV